MLRVTLAALTGFAISGSVVCKVNAAKEGATFFERVFGVQEGSYDSAHSWFAARSSRDANGSWFIRTGPPADLSANGDVGVVGGRFETPSVAELRATAATLGADLRKRRPHDGPWVTLEHLEGDARSLHEELRYAGAVFQAASQFNCLEMATPFATPERGITCYRSDPTQGPACAIACAGGTAVRNYLVPMGNGQTGQTAKNQIDTMEGCHRLLLESVEGRRFLWKVRNGYIESSPKLLDLVNRALRTRTKDVEAALRIGIQWDAEVCSDAKWGPQPRDAPRHFVTQTFNSAVSIGYSNAPDDAWARAVLRATYEATLLAGVITNAKRGLAGLPPTPVLLTKVGGGVFRNQPEWISEAIAESVRRVSKYEVRVPLILVHFGACEPAYLHLATPQRSDDL